MTAARIRRAVREGRVEIAPQDKIVDHWQRVERILQDIGFPEALVTDESCFSDFPLFDAERPASPVTQKDARMGAGISMHIFRFL